jgi:hypothetical protein
MRRILSIIVLFLAAIPFGPSGAPGGESPTEIRIGKAPPPAPRPDPAYARAAERFLAARQGASLDRSREPGVRRWLAAAVKADAATLIGAPGQTLVAFDFKDGGIQRLASGAFRISAYLLFADRQGRVVESRDETLILVGGPTTFVCASLKTASVMHWDSGEVVKTAEQLKSRDALEQADEFLRIWAKQQARSAAYSIEDIYPAGYGKIMIPCLKFTAEFGKRGYDVVDSPIIMRRGPRGYQFDPPAN